jgi:hypothetical protein
VFDKIKIGKIDPIVKKFVEVIMDDAYLRHMWGDDVDTVKAALAEVIEVF